VTAMAANMTRQKTPTRTQSAEAEQDRVFLCCLRLAVVTGQPVGAVLRSQGLAEYAILLEELYRAGPGAAARRTLSSSLPSLLTIREVVARTGLSRGAVYQRVEAGVFVSQARIGNTGPLLIVEATVEAWRQRRTL